MHIGVDEIYVFAKRENKTIKFEVETENFNYVSMESVSDFYLKGIAVIMLDDQTFVSQAFFIEPGRQKNGFFINDKQLHGKTVMFVKCVFYNLENKSGRFEIKSIDFSERETFQSAVLRNGNIYAGFSSEFGGVVSFLTSERYKISESMQDGSVCIRFRPESVTEAQNNANLLNIYDNGRFPQQTYYGTGNPPYQPAIYKETPWVFNPVQGGDSYGNRSPIVDFSVSPDSVWFRLMPLDWAKNGILCDCYMESRYSLVDNCLRVSNRVVDFSMLNCGMECRPIEQECPSLNIISSLDKYFVSVGDTSVDEIGQLKFWAEEEKVIQQRFLVKKQWSCMLNKDGYGIGLFTPHTKLHLAGKYKVEKDNTIPSAKAESVNHIAGVCKFALESLKPIEYEYYIGVGSRDELAKGFCHVANKTNSRNGEIK